MNRRELIRQAGLTAAAFAMSRDLFAGSNMIEHKFADFRKEIFLQSNENPYGPSKAAKEAMMEALTSTNRYQWQASGQLIQAIAKEHRLAEENVLLGAGSSDLLGLTAHYAAFDRGHIVAPDPTFRIWTVAADRMGLPIRWVPLTGEKDTDLQAMQLAIDSDTRMVYLCNPNNPTGIPIPDQELRDFIKAVPKHIIILMDEAYTEFEDTPSVIDMIDEYPNLVIAKTFSKIYGLAGARIGYLLANNRIIDELGKLQPWKNANASAASVAGALASMQDREFVSYCRAENKKCRALFHQGLQDLGIQHTPSVTSFTYFDTAAYPGNFPEVLKSNNIIGARSFEENSTWMRLSVGNEAEMTEVVRVLKTGIK